MQAKTWEEFSQLSRLIKDPEEIKALGFFHLLEDKINPSQTFCRFPADQLTEEAFLGLPEGLGVVTAVDEEGDLVYFNRMKKVNALYFHLAREAKEEIYYVEKMDE